MQLADRSRHDADFRSVLDIWVGHDDDLARTLSALIAEEHVPYLPRGKLDVPKERSISYRKLGREVAGRDRRRGAGDPLGRRGGRPGRGRR
jgi:hypothetical protein